MGLFNRKLLQKSRIKLLLFLLVNIHILFIGSVNGSQTVITYCESAIYNGDINTARRQALTECLIKSIRFKYGETGVARNSIYESIANNKSIWLYRGFSASFINGVGHLKRIVDEGELNGRYYIKAEYNVHELKDLKWLTYDARTLEIIWKSIGEPTLSIKADLQLKGEVANYIQNNLLLSDIKVTRQPSDYIIRIHSEFEGKNTLYYNKDHVIGRAIITAALLQNNNTIVKIRETGNYLPNFSSEEVLHLSVKSSGLIKKITDKIMFALYLTGFRELYDGNTFEVTIEYNKKNPYIFKNIIKGDAILNAIKIGSSDINAQFKFKGSTSSLVKVLRRYLDIIDWDCQEKLGTNSIKFFGCM